MQENISLPTAGLIVIQDNKMLLGFSNNKHAWYLPGGKIDIGEDSMQSLQREILEELNLVLDPTLLTFYCHISAPAYGEKRNVIMEQDCYLYELNEEIEPCNEIAAVKFFDYRTYKSEPIQVIGVLKVFEKLIGDRLLH
ncbi:MAG TPA: NUDIX domain-containing protein [Segetibacter sp.]|jgi:8-oxo-dGTP pyrophosphatase MutT (NUDIX family)